MKKLFQKLMLYDLKDGWLLVTAVILAMMVMSCFRVRYIKVASMGQV